MEKKMYLKKAFCTSAILVLFTGISAAFAQDYVSREEMTQMKKEMQELKSIVNELNETIKAQNKTIRTLQEHEKEDEHGPEVASPEDEHAEHEPSEKHAEGEGVDMLASPEDEHAEHEPSEKHADGEGVDMHEILASIKPKINLTGDFVANFSDDHHLRTEEERFDLRGVDIIFSGEIDDVAEAHFTLAYHDDDVSLEEGYLDVHDLLPFGTDVKLGRFRAGFGLLNTFHPHALPQVDYPAIYREYLGHEGYIDEGVGISGEFASAWDTPFQYSLQVLNGDRHEHGDEEEEAHGHGSAYKQLKDYDDLVYVARLQNRIIPAHSFNVRWGLSGLSGKFEDEHDSPRFYYQGGDLTFNWRPFKDEHKRIRWQSEIIAAQVEEGSSWERSYGLYSFLDYQFAPQWLVGGRYDYTELPQYSSDHLTELSAYLTHDFTESNRIRLQFKNTQRNHDKDSNEFFLQWIFTLGQHEDHEGEEH
jgi:hypothetical protein